jgi:hypothetical protein
MNEDINDFLQTKLTFAAVIRADLSQIQALKQYLAEQGLTLVYQKTSTNKCYIKEEE